MQEGFYGGWEHIDSDLMSHHLFGHPKAQLAKQAQQPVWSTPKDMLKTILPCFQVQQMPYPCQIREGSQGQEMQLARLWGQLLHKGQLG